MKFSWRVNWKWRMSRVSWYTLDLLFLLWLMLWDGCRIFRWMLSLLIKHLGSDMDMFLSLLFEILYLSSCLPEMLLKLTNEKIVLRVILSPILKLNDHLTSNWHGSAVYLNLHWDLTAFVAILLLWFSNF
jgi:hypothetical protein